MTSMQAALLGTGSVPPGLMTRVNAAARVKEVFGL